MNENKKIIDYCPNYYKIINFNPIISDEITLKLIGMYKEFIFNIDYSNMENIEEIKQLDQALSKYIDDYLFRREVQKKVLIIENEKTDNIIKKIIDAIVNLFKNYDEYTTRIIYISRWI